MALNCGSDDGTIDEVMQCISYQDQLPGCPVHFTGPLAVTMPPDQEPLKDEKYDEPREYAAETRQQAALLDRMRQQP